VHFVLLPRLVCLVVMGCQGSEAFMAAKPAEEGHATPNLLVRASFDEHMLKDKATREKIAVEGVLPGAMEQLATRTSPRLSLSGTLLQDTKHAYLSKNLPADSKLTRGLGLLPEAPEGLTAVSSRVVESKKLEAYLMALTRAEEQEVDSEQASLRDLAAEASHTSNAKKVEAEQHQWVVTETTTEEVASALAPGCSWICM